MNNMKKRFKKPVKIALIVGAVMVLAGASVFAASSSNIESIPVVIDHQIPQQQDTEINSMQQDVVKDDGSQGIGIEKAEKTALAQVKGATEKHVVSVSEDRDDSRLEYDVEIHYGGKEYEFEIDGVSGKIISSDIDIIDKDDKYDDDGYDDDRCDD